MAVLFWSFHLKSGPADKEARGRYDGGTARDPYGATVFPTLLSNPCCWRQWWGIRRWRRRIKRRKYLPHPLPSTSTTRALGVGMALWVGKRYKGGQHCCRLRIPHFWLLIQAEIWHILIQVKIWWMFHGSVGDSPHIGDVSDIGRQASAIRAQRISTGWDILLLLISRRREICCCFSLGEGEICFLL